MTTFLSVFLGGGLGSLVLGIGFLFIGIKIGKLCF